MDLGLVLGTAVVRLLAVVGTTCWLQAHLDRRVAPFLRPCPVRSARPVGWRPVAAVRPCPVRPVGVVAAGLPEGPLLPGRPGGHDAPRPVRRQ